MRVNVISSYVDECCLCLGGGAASYSATSVPPDPTRAPFPMTRTTATRLDMLRTVLTHLDASPDLWHGHRPIADTVAVVRAGLAGLDQAARDQAASNPRGMTKTRKAARARAVAALGALGQSTGAYALSGAGRADFRVATTRSARDWARLPEADFVSLAGVALNRIETALADLAEYGVTAAETDAARAAVGAVVPLTIARDRTAARRAVATAALRTGYSALVEPLGLLDRLVPVLIKDATFVAVYAHTRRIRGR